MIIGEGEQIELKMNRLEAELLLQALRSHLKETRLEIARTDDLKYRADLQNQFEILKSIEDRLADSLFRRKAG